LLGYRSQQRRLDDSLRAGANGTMARRYPKLPFAGIIQIRFGGYFSPAALARRRTPSVCHLAAARRLYARLPQSANDLLRRHKTAPPTIGSDELDPPYREPYDEYIGKIICRHVRQSEVLAPERHEDHCKTAQHYLEEEEGQPLHLWQETTYCQRVRARIH